MSDKRVDRILIIGGGTAGWMTAAALSNALGRAGRSVTLVESDAIGTVGVGESTIPHIRYFNERLGIDEADFLEQTGATFKLAIEFRDWGRIGDRYMHPFGAYGGGEFETADFFNTWMAAGGHGSAPLDDHSLPIRMARAERFVRPDLARGGPADQYGYAYQFDAALYARYLRSFSEARGVTRREGRVVDVAQDPESGDVTSVTLDDGAELSADLFIDCSGFRGLLIEQVLEAGYEDWSHWLPCDRAIALPSRSTNALPPYTRATALEAGWAWRIPLQHRVGNGHVYSSAFLSDDRAETLLREQIEGDVLAEPNRLRFKAGKRRSQWRRNVVAIGLSSGFLEPLESTSIHLVQAAIGHLLDLFPAGRSWTALRDTFNQTMGLEYKRVRDFLILHYHATQRDDSEFWRYCRTMEIPDSLAAKIELFRECGVVERYEQGVFLEPSWLAVYAGQHVLPRAIDPRTPAPAEAAGETAALRTRLEGMVAAMPFHAEALGLRNPAAVAE